MTTAADRPATVLNLRLPVVDGLRGIAILLVIYQHAFSRAVFAHITSQSDGVFPYFVRNAWMGVSLFFVLSGFVLALPYFSGQRDITAPGAIAHFYQHRAWRLLPLFLFIALVSQLLSVSWDVRALVMTLSTLSMFDSNYFLPAANPVLWSLNVEIWFSALFPLLLLALKRYGWMRVLTACLVIAACIRVPGAYFAFSNDYVNPVRDFVLARCDDFLMGMAVCYLWVSGRLPKRPGLMFAGGSALLIVSMLVWDLHLQNAVPPYLLAFTNNLTNLGFSLILAGGIQSRGLIRRALSAWWLRLVGAMCFSLYCWHDILIPVDLINQPLDPWAHLRYWLPLLVLSAATYRWIEFPKAPSVEKLFLLVKTPASTPAGQS